MADNNPAAIPEQELEQARAVHRANAQISEMRSSLSMLSSASATLADALSKRNQQYDGLMAHHAALTRQLEAVQTELKLATAERAGLLEEVTTRNAQLFELEAFAESKVALEEQLAQAQAGVEAGQAEVDALNARVAGLESQAAAVLGEKADVEARLAAAEAELAEIDVQLAAWEQELAGGPAERLAVEAPVELADGRTGGGATRLRGAAGAGNRGGDRRNR